MQEIILTILHPTGTAEIEVPVDISIKELLGELRAVLPLNSGQEYRVDSKGLGRRLLDNETIESAKIPPNDSFIITPEVMAGGTGGPIEKKESRISVIESSIGLQLDDLSAIEIKSLLANEPALMMTLHSYRATLSQLDDSRQELKKAKEEIEQLLDRLKEKNIATALLILGQIQIGFGTNLITSHSSGGWFVFLSGVAVNLGALYFSFFGFRKPSKR